MTLYELFILQGVICNLDQFQILTVQLSHE
jgi:hypothetical protein